MEEHADLSGSAMTAEERALTRQQLEQRRSAARGDYIT